MKAEQIGTELKPVDWRGVRSEYYKIAVDLPLLFAAWDVPLDGSLRNHIEHLLAAMSRVDAIVDRVSDLEARQRTGNAVVAFMRGMSADAALPGALRDHLQPLRRIIGDMGSTEPFCAAIAEGLSAAEAKRAATDTNAYMSALMQENTAVLKLTTLIVRPMLTPRLEALIRRTICIGSFIDTLLDADEDYRQNEMQFRPGAIFSCRLVLEMTCWFTCLMLLFPHPLFLLRFGRSYCKRAVTPLDQRALPAGII
jgi:hypothetical protein